MARIVVALILILFPIGSYAQGRKAPLSSACADCVSVHQKTIRLDNDQITHLPTTPVEVIPAPGAGRVVIPTLFAGLTYIESSYGFDFKLPSWVLVQGPYSYVSNTLFFNQHGGLLPFAASAPYTEQGGGAFEPGLVSYPGSHLVDTATTIKDDWNGLADYTGGGPNNYAIISVTYLILNTSTGLFE